MQAKLRSKKLDENELREASRSLDRVASEVSIEGRLDALLVPDREGARERVRGAELRKGSRVWVPRLRAEAEVLEVTGASVRVAAGPLKLTVSIDELRVTTPAAEPPKPLPKRAAPAARPESSEVAIQTSDNCCDLRGLRADDALSLATTFLDRSLNEGRRVAFLVHGHGTGALRDALRKELRESRYVSHFRGGSSGEGGDGVTVVWLA